MWSHLVSFVSSSLYKQVYLLQDEIAFHHGARSVAHFFHDMAAGGFEVTVTVLLYL